MNETNLYSNYLGKKKKYFTVSFCSPFKHLLNFQISNIEDINEKSVRINLLFFKFYYVLKTDLPF
jgi:hypothetical protein